MAIKNTPEFKFELQEPDLNKPQFINVIRNSLKITYPNGTQKTTAVDSIKRKNPDAVVIMPFKVINGKMHTFLRSCIRPGAVVRSITDPNFEYSGVIWEFAAWIIDPGETAAEAAKRECMEELGFDIELERFVHVQTVLSMPSLIAERLEFFMVHVLDTDEFKEPSLDGSALEEGGEILEISLEDLYNNIFEIPDLKTNLGARILADILQF